MKMKMKQVQQQVKRKINTDKIIIGLIIVVFIGLWVFVRYQVNSYKPVKTTYKNPIEKQMRRNRYERNLSRQHGKQLKKVFDYIDR